MQVISAAQHQRPVARLVVVRNGRPLPHGELSALRRPRQVVTVADDVTRCVGPSGFSGALDLVHWASAVVVTTHIGTDADRALIVAQARRRPRVLVVMTRPEQVQSWHDYVNGRFPRKPITLRTCSAVGADSAKT